VLEQTDDATSELSPDLMSLRSSSEEKFQERPDDDVEDIAETIKSIHYRLEAQQKIINEGIYQKSGPGRKRKFGPKSSKQLKSLVMGYLRKHFDKIISNKKCKERKDALITIFIR